MRGGAISITTILWLVLSTGVCAQELDYQAREGCPSRADFERRLASRVRARPGTTLALTVRITDVAALTLREGTALIGERTLRASTCEEAVEALAFVAALLLEERARSEPALPPAREQRAPRRSRRPPTTAPLATSDDATQSEEARQSEEALALPASPPASEDFTRRGDETESDESDETESTPPRAPAPATRARGVSDWRSQLDLEALLAHGLTPVVRPGLAAQAGLRWTRGVHLTFALGARALLPHDQRSEQGDARFRWASATLQACIGPALPRARPVVCVDAELGRVRARGRDTDAPADVRSPWFALGPALSMRIPLWGPLQLATGLGLLVPLTRDRFTLAGRELHHVPPATFRASLGLALEFE